MANPNGRPRVDNPKRNKTLKLAARTHIKLSQLKRDTGISEAVIIESLVDDADEIKVKKLTAK